MWTEEVIDTMMEFQPGKIFPVKKRAFVKEDGTRVEAAGGAERGFHNFIYKGRDLEFEMKGRLVRPYPPSGDLIFHLEPYPYYSIDQFIKLGKIKQQDLMKFPAMKQDISEAFLLLPLWLHLPPDLSSRRIRIEFDEKFGA